MEQQSQQPQQRPNEYNGLKGQSPSPTFLPPPIPEDSDNMDNMPIMRKPTAPSTPKTLYELKDPIKTQLVYYFVEDDIKTTPKIGNLTNLPTLGFGFFGKYTVQSGNNIEKVDKVYTPNQSLGKGTPVQVVAGVGGRRRKSKKVFKNNNKNKKRNSRKSRKYSKRSRRH